MQVTITLVIPNGAVLQAHCLSSWTEPFFRRTVCHPERSRSSGVLFVILNEAVLQA